jgi:hypothetical protein
MLEGTLNKLRLVGNALHEGFISEIFQGLAMPRFAAWRRCLADCNDCFPGDYDL